MGMGHTVTTAKSGIDLREQLNSLGHWSGGVYILKGQQDFFFFFLKEDNGKSYD